MVIYWALETPFPVETCFLVGPLTYPARSVVQMDLVASVAFHQTVLPFSATIAPTMARCAFDHCKHQLNKSAKTTRSTLKMVFANAVDYRGHVVRKVVLLSPSSSLVVVLSLLPSFLGGAAFPLFLWCGGAFFLLLWVVLLSPPPFGWCLLHSCSRLVVLSSSCFLIWRAPSSKRKANEVTLTTKVNFNGILNVIRATPREEGNTTQKEEGGKHHPKGGRELHHDNGGGREGSTPLKEQGRRSSPTTRKRRGKAPPHQSRRRESTTTRKEGGRKHHKLQGDGRQAPSLQMEQAGRHHVSRGGGESSTTQGREEKQHPPN